MSANREYKNSVFTAIFDDTGDLLSLYNALSGSDLPKDTPVCIATLEDVLFTERRNDIAFVVGGKIVILIEHQSTINENMPLRLLIYVARVYEKLIDNEAIYKRRLLKIPRPDFIVLYNGSDAFPDEKTLLLSDAFLEHPDAIADSYGGLLELEVRVININEGRNDDMVKKCEKLDGYVRFVGKVRTHQKSSPDLTTALTMAVKECIEEGILEEFMKTHSSEVINMFTTEWNAELEKKVLKQEGREEGRMEGRVEGRVEGRMEGREEGLDISAKVLRSLIMKEPIEAISVRYGVPEDKVRELRSVLLQQSA